MRNYISCANDTLMCHWRYFQAIIAEAYMNKYVNASSLISIPNTTLSQDILDSILYAQLLTRDYHGGSALSDFSTQGLQNWFVTFFNVLTGQFADLGDAGWRDKEDAYGDTMLEYDKLTPQGGNISTKSSVQDIFNKNVYDAAYFACGLNETDQNNMQGMVSDLSDALKKSESAGQSMSIWDDNTRSGNNVCSFLSSCYKNEYKDKYKNEYKDKIVLFISMLAFTKNNCNNQFLWGGVDSIMFRGYLHCAFDPDSYNEVRDTIGNYLKNTTQNYVNQLDL